MKILYILTILMCPSAAWAMHPTARIGMLGAHKKISACALARGFSSHKIDEPWLKNNHSRSAWKQAYAEYQRALIDREKCKTWKQLGYGMHDGYCTSGKSCDCTHRLILIAKK